MRNEILLKLLQALGVGICATHLPLASSPHRSTVSLLDSSVLCLWVLLFIIICHEECGASRVGCDSCLGTSV
jgi:hypothetical protein